MYVTQFLIVVIVVCKKTIAVVLVAELCLSLCDPMDCSLPYSSVHGNLLARTLVWVAIPFSRESS